MLSRVTDFCMILRMVVGQRRILTGTSDSQRWGARMPEQRDERAVNCLPCMISALLRVVHSTTSHPLVRKTGFEDEW